jgi:predicted nucleic acid-binding protein
VTLVRFFYLDASALAKRYVPERGSALVDHLFASVTPDRFWVFNVGIGEVVSLLVRKRNVGALPPAALVQAIADFMAEVGSSTALRKVVAQDALVTASLDLIQTHSINATDAIILQSALDISTLLKAAGDDLVLVASDLRLLRAAQAVGHMTFNPETQTLADLNALI